VTEPIVRVLREKIKASEHVGVTEGGREARGISFRDYMDVCLYDPLHGYYSGGKARVGREGDFYTSSYIGEAFSECLARRLAELADEYFGGEEPVRVIDWGGGTGRLAAQLLAVWEAEGERRFDLTVVDGNPSHRELAVRSLEPHIGRGRAFVLSPEEAEARDWSRLCVIVIGNELLDAMPVHRVVRKEGQLREWGVSWDELRCRLIPCLLELPAWLAERMDRDRILVREGQTAEVGADAGRWLAKLASSLGRALLVFIDYGDESEELTAEHRMNGTLVCYRNHIARDNPLEAPGEQDLTAHVNFTGLRAAAREAGLEELWYGTQLRFLMESGVLRRLVPLSGADPFHPDARRNRAIRQLLLSDAMSELFKVQIFRKGLGS